MERQEQSGMSEQRPSKDQLARALERVAVYRPYATSVLPYARHMIALADEIERLQRELAGFKPMTGEELVAWAVTATREPPHCSTCGCGLAHEPGSDTPVGWRYEINGEYVAFSESKPPSDAYDEGTLQPLYARPAEPPGNAVGEIFLGWGSGPPPPAEQA